MSNLKDNEIKSSINIVYKCMICGRIGNDEVLWQTRNLNSSLLDGHCVVGDLIEIKTDWETIKKHLYEKDILMAKIEKLLRDKYNTTETGY